MIDKGIPVLRHKRLLSHAAESIRIKTLTRGDTGLDDYTLVDEYAQVIELARSLQIWFNNAVNEIENDESARIHGKRPPRLTYISADRPPKAADRRPYATQAGGGFCFEESTYDPGTYRLPTSRIAL